MKATKKLMAMVLALMMALSIMAVPAMASDADEGIMLLGPMVRCRNCNEWVEATVSTRGPTSIIAEPHDGIEIRHIHDVTTHREHYYCEACGENVNRTWDTYVCRGGQ